LALFYRYACATCSPVRDEVLLLGDDLGVVRREHRCDIRAGRWISSISAAIRDVITRRYSASVPPAFSRCAASRAGRGRQIRQPP
jgi:hypothetical protein